MKKQFYLASVALAAILAVFAACGDDSASGSNEPVKVGKLENLAKDCEEGEEALVGEKEIHYTCQDGKWVTEEKSSNSTKLSSSSVEDESSSSEECDEDDCDGEEDEIQSSSSSKKRSSSSRKDDDSDGSGSGKSSDSGSGESSSSESEYAKYAFNSVSSTILAYDKNIDLQTVGASKESVFGCRFNFSETDGMEVRDGASVVDASKLKDHFFENCSMNVKNVMTNIGVMNRTISISSYCVEEDVCVDLDELSETGLSLNFKFSRYAECTNEEYAVYVKSGGVVFLTKYRRALTNVSLLDASMFAKQFYKADGFSLAYCASDEQGVKRAFSLSKSNTENYAISQIKVDHDGTDVTSDFQKMYSVRLFVYNVCGTLSKMNLIKAFRNATGLGLAEARNYVEANLKVDLSKVGTDKDNSFELELFQEYITLDTYRKWVSAFNALGIHAKAVDWKDAVLLETDDNSLVCPESSSSSAS